MKPDNSSWVVCINCGHQYYLEDHSVYMYTCCSLCSSKLYKVAEKQDEWDMKILKEIDHILSLV